MQLLNEPGLGAGINPGMTLTPFPSSIGCNLNLRPSNHEPSLLTKALQNWKISVKALTKQLWKLTIKTKRLSRFKLLSFVHVNDKRLTIN